MEAGEEPKVRDGKGRFVPGHKAVSAGRPVGTVNKYTAEVKEVLMTAGANIGFDGKGKNGLLGFFEKLGRDNPAALAVHIVRANCPMPKSDDDPGNTPGPITFNIVSVPSDRYLSREQIKALEQPRLIVDNAAALEGATVIDNVVPYADAPAPAPAAPEPEPRPQVDDSESSDEPLTYDPTTGRMIDAPSQEQDRQRAARHAELEAARAAKVPGAVWMGGTTRRRR
jgi:hypothetical protein